MRLAVPFALSFAFASCALFPVPPKVAISVPSAFSGEVGRHEFRRGAPLSLNASVMQMYPSYRAKKPMTAIYGRWTDASFISYSARGTYYGAAKHRTWFVEVRRGAPSATLQRALQAKDGYEADLGFGLDSSPRIYPRFRHKHFSWGEAVSFLVQYQNDNTNDVPNNGMLLYEVHGITNDQKYTIRAQFGLTHPHLREFGPGLHNYRDNPSKPDSAMRRDPDYLLVETCPDGAFQPSIKDIDAMLDTLRPGSSQ